MGNKLSRGYCVDRKQVLGEGVKSLAGSCLAVVSPLTHVKYLSWYEQTIWQIEQPELKQALRLLPRGANL